MKRLHTVDNCLERVKNAEWINTVQDVHEELDKCANDLKTAKRSGIITQSEYEEYKKQFAKIFSEKRDAIYERHEAKGQSYGYIPKHKSSPSRSIYFAQRKSM